MQPRQPMRGIATSLLLLVSSTWNLGVLAHPYAKDELHDLGYGYLMDRDCYQYCGYNNQYCCSSGSTCYTSQGIAGCSASAGGGYAWYTTTWTETETFTSTISSYYPAATASAGSAACTPPAGSGEIACGTICCASWQYCAYEGQCSANAGATGSGSTVTTVITSNGQTITTQYSAPYRVTSGASATTTETGALSSETSTANGTIVGASTAGNLSGGAIAGIVIGTLAGVVILLALCACFVVRGLWHTLLGILGLRRKQPRRTTETIIEEERYSRRGSVHSRRDRHDSWYNTGGRGRPSTVADRKEKTGGGRGWLGLGAAAGTLMLLLGLRRDKNRRKASAAAKTRSDYSSTYYSDSYTETTPSSRSSDRRTRDTRRTRETRTTRVSRGPSRVPSRAPSRR